MTKPETESVAAAAVEKTTPTQKRKSDSDDVATSEEATSTNKKKKSSSSSSPRFESEIFIKSYFGLDSPTATYYYHTFVLADIFILESAI